MKSKLKIVVCLLVFFITQTNSSYTQTKDSSSQASGGVEEQVYQLKDSLLELNDSDAGRISGTDSNKILKWKHSREFAYIHYLDSLLRKQKNLKTDTVSINEKSGKIIRNLTTENKVSALNTILNSLPLKIFFWIMAIGFIVITGYKVLVSKGIFAKKRKNSAEVTDDRLVSDLGDLSQYDALISGAENANDLNMATRYLYLKSLKNLSEKGLINFSSDKTNSEYLEEMKSNDYFKEFQSLTHSYEYLWYGKFLIEEKKYQILKEEFILFNKIV